MITGWNRGAETLYGWSASEAVGRLPAEILHSDFGVPRANVLTAIERDGRWSGTIVQTHRDGRRVIVDARWVMRRPAGAEPATVLEINRDITEQTLAGERFRLIVESVRDYAIFMLDARARVASWNPGASNVTGWDVEETVGRPLPLLATPERAEGIPPEALELAERAGQWSDEGWLVRKDGSIFWGQSVITALRGPAGLLHGFAVIIHDETVRRELEDARANFVNFAAHEMRAPVTLLHGYLSMLREGDLGVDGFRSALPTIMARTEELQLLIEQMIESSRLEQGRLDLRLVELDLRPVVEDVVRLSRTLGGPSHPVRIRLPDAEVRVVADQVRIRSIIRNLLDNAVKYSPRGGEVACRIAVREGLAWVSVSDHGIGIEQRDLPRVFSRYGRIRTKETAGIPGAGLGLYMSRELARLHNGDLTVSSVPGEGSTFTLTLPLAGSAGAPRPERAPDA